MASVLKKLNVTNLLDEKSLGLPVIVSIGLHVAILILASVTLPFIARDLPELKQLNVEIVEVDEITQSRLAKKKENEKPPTPPKAPEKPKPPKVVEEKPPALPEDVPDLKTAKEAAEKTPPKVKPKSKPKPPAPKKKEEKKDDFQSLLKNLTPDAEEEQTRELSDILEETSGPQDQSLIGRLSNKLTLSEEDALRAQLSRCWNVLAGAKYAEDLVVEVFVEMNSDRTVYQASILDKGRYNRDSAFRAAGDSALRALRNPACTPLALPPEKYEQWKTINIRFDPRQML